MLLVWGLHFENHCSWKHKTCSRPHLHSTCDRVGVTLPTRSHSHHSDILTKAITSIHFYKINNGVHRVKALIK